MEMQHLEELEDRYSNSVNSRPLAKLMAVAIFCMVAVIGWNYFGPRSAFANGEWNTDWEAAVQASKSSGKPALVLFTADWCPACKQFEAETLANESMRKYLRENYTLVMVDLSDRNGPNIQRAQEFGVKSIPTVILYDRTGAEKARGNGMPSDAMMAWLGSGGGGAQYGSAR